MYQYTYDYRNRLVEIEELSTGTQLYTFSYDHENRLIEYTQNGISKTLSYAGPEVIEETENTNTAITVTGNGIDQPIVKFQDSKSLYKTTTNVQHVITITDNNGDVEVKITTDEFGNLLKAYDSNNSEIALPDYCTNFFQGRTALQGTPLYNYRSRHYSAALGRFLQPDEFGYGADMNLYRFVQNNPTLYVDPDGKIPPLIIGMAVGAVIGGVFSAVMNWDKSGTDFAVAVGSGVVAGALMGTGYGVASFAAGGAAGGLMTGGYEGYKAGGTQGAIYGGTAGAVFGGLGGAAGGFFGGKIGTAVAGRVYSGMIAKGYGSVSSNMAAGYAAVGAGGIANGAISGGTGGFGHGLGQGLASGQSVSDSLRMGAGNIAPGAFYGGLLGGAMAVGAKGLQQGLMYANKKNMNGVFGDEGEWNVRNQTGQRMNKDVTTPPANGKGRDSEPDLWGTNLKGDVKNTSKIPSPNAQNAQFQSFYNEIVGQRGEVFNIFHRPGIKLPGPDSAVGKWVTNGEAKFTPITQWAWAAPISRDWNC